MRQYCLIAQYFFPHILGERWYITLDLLWNIVRVRQSWKAPAAIFIFFV